MKTALKIYVLSTMLLFGVNALASNALYEFETLQQERLFQALLTELRCPKCQNQNLMDSNSEISNYMKQRIYEMVREGKSHQQVVDILRERYGDFISYKPPFNWQTAALWLLPLLALLAGCIVWWRQMRRFNQN